MASLDREQQQATWNMNTETNQRVMVAAVIHVVVNMYINQNYPQ